MATITAKTQLLEDSGYAYSFDREIYLNRKVRKAFSLEFVEDHSEEVLVAKINEPVQSSGKWQFYFSLPPSPGVERELSAILG